MDANNNIAKLLVFTPTRTLLGYMTLRRPSKQTEAEYDKRKDAFLGMVTARSTSSKDYIQETAAKMLRDEDFMMTRNQLEKIAVIQSKFPNMTGEEHRMIMSWANMAQRKRVINVKY